jgi:ISXO2-like transposase domain/Transposase zinc-ribbon domain
MSAKSCSLIAFQRRFPDDAACAAYLFAKRWPDGFVCPSCDRDQAWPLRTKRFTFECRSCHRQTSVTAGTVMHRSHLPLTVWFWAAHLLSTHSNGLSALQLKAQLGLGSYKTAWLLCHKLRRAMVDPGRSLLGQRVEIDETSLPQRTKNDPPGGRGRSHTGKMAVAGAIEIEDRKPRRLRLQTITDYSAKTLRGFIEETVAPGACIRTDGWSSYAGTPNVTHDPVTVGSTAAHMVLPWIHKIFSNLKTWSLGVFHGLRRKHLQAYLDEFVFRFNRRHDRAAAFDTILRIASRLKQATYKMVIAPELTE